MTLVCLNRSWSQYEFGTTRESLSREERDVISLMTMRFVNLINLQFKVKMDTRDPNTVKASRSLLVQSVDKTTLFMGSIVITSRSASSLSFLEWSLVIDPAWLFTLQNGVRASPLHLLLMFSPIFSSPESDKATSDLDFIIYVVCGSISILWTGQTICDVKLIQNQCQLESFQLVQCPL